MHPYSVRMSWNKDLHIGQKLEGVVRNVVDFGAFVDIGIHEDGFDSYIPYEQTVYQASKPGRLSR